MQCKDKSKKQKNIEEAAEFHGGISKTELIEAAFYRLRIHYEKYHKDSEELKALEKAESEL